MGGEAVKRKIKFVNGPNLAGAAKKQQAGTFPVCRIFLGGRQNCNSECLQNDKIDKPLTFPKCFLCFSFQMLLCLNRIICLFVSQIYKAIQVIKTLECYSS